jgi:hypothetical protein
VLDRGQLVLALWAGVDGGTARALAEAEKRGKPVVNLWTSWVAAGGQFTPAAG